VISVAGSLERRGSYLIAADACLCRRRFRVAIFDLTPTQGWG